MKWISSAKNPHLKELKGLQEKSKLRSRSQSFFVEGEKEIRFAKEGGFEIKALFFRADGLENHSAWTEEFENKVPCYAVERPAFESHCYRSNTSTMIAVVAQNRFGLTELELSANPLLLVAESPEKPGNIGALLRTADAVGADALIIVDAKTDLYNPNVIRSSVGCIFSVPWAGCTKADFFNFLRLHKIELFSAALTSDAQLYTTQDYTKAVAIAVGSEDKGLSKEWLNESDKHIVLPMLGRNDSLNVSVAAGILMYEVHRQRNL